MAGGFGGDDEDFEQYENDEETEQDEELDNENVDEDEEDVTTDEDDNEDEANKDDVDDEEDSESKDGGGQVAGKFEEKDPKATNLKEYLLKFEAKRLKPKLFKLKEKLLRTRKFRLNFLDKWRFNRAKNNKFLKKEVEEIDMILAMNKVIATNKFITAIAPAIPFILLFGFILFALIALTVIIAYMFPWLFPEDDLGNGGNSGSAFGASGEHFYGTRLIYRNEEKASATLLEEYVDVVSESITQITSISEIEKDGTKYDIEVTVDITLPAEDYEYETFTAEDEEKFSTDYSELYTLVNTIAGEVAKVDDPGASAETLVDKFKAIKYFGFDETMNTNVKTVLYNYLITDYDFEFVGTTANKDDFKNDVNGQIQTKIDNMFDQESYKVRAEKLFVRDCVFDTNSEMMTTAKEDYLIMMYLPKQQVTISYFAFNVSGENVDNIELSLSNNGANIPLSKDNGIDWGEDIEGAGKYFVYSSSKDLAVSAGVTELFDENLTEEFKAELENGVSFIKAIRGLSDFTKYFEMSADGYLTYKKAGIALSFANAENPFSFTDEITIAN